MPNTPFDEWDISDARLAVALTTEQKTKLDSYRKFVEGDHWQDWAGWTGPLPTPGTADELTMRAEIERGFISRNVLGWCTGIHVNGVLGRNVKWSVVPQRELDKDETPTPDEQTRIDEAEGLLKQWVKDRKLNQEYDKLGKALLTAGVAYQRPFVAPGEINKNGIVPIADLATSLGRVYFNFPLPGEAVVWTDPRTQQKCSIYLYREVTSSRPSVAAKQQGDERAELTYLDGDDTIIRIVGGETDSTSEFSYSLGKRILMSDMNRPALIDEQVVSQQKLLNKTLSMKSRNMDMAGFRERVTYNAKMSGENITVRNSDGTERVIFVPDPLPKGPSAQTNLTGELIVNDDGRSSLATPGMDWIDPVPVTSFLDTELSAYLAILGDCNLLHYSMAGDAVASGTSRQTAMAAYLIDLLQTKQQIDAGWAWLLETALSLAAVLSGQEGRYGDLRVSAECSVDPGPISTEMMTVTSALVSQGQLSLETGLSWLGVEDVDSELAAIEAEQEVRSEREAEMARIALENAQREFNAGQVQDEALEDEPASPQGRRNGERI